MFKKKEPQPDAYVMSLWDNIEVGKKYVIGTYVNECGYVMVSEVEITNLTDDKKAVKFTGEMTGICWRTAKDFINNLIDEVSQ